MHIISSLHTELLFVVKVELFVVIFKNMLHISNTFFGVIFSVYTSSLILKFSKVIITMLVFKEEKLIQILEVAHLQL